jgi:hypothetical protein
MRGLLPFLQRLLLTIVAMFTASWIAGLVPCWEFLKGIRPSKGR